MRIYLVRHGETEWNRTRRFQGRSNLPLNQEGKKQVRALALALKNEPLTAIYTSPLIRAFETARLIKVFHPSTPIIEEKGLIEMNLGEFDGMKVQDWAEQYPDIRKSWNKNPASVKMPGGESLKEVQARAKETLERITRIYSTDTTILISSHNFVNLTILCDLLKIPLNRFRELRQENAAFNVICKKGNRFYVELVNEGSHLGIRERT
ncbi:MAG: histidine phosphatase family protein [Desulfobacterales bacterium]